MDNETICFTCQDFKVNVGHETKWCPKNICKKCGQNGHTKIECMVDYENLPLPNEILLKIFDYFDDEDLDKYSQVSVKIKKICDKLINTRKIESKQLLLLLHAHSCLRKDNDSISFQCPYPHCHFTKNVLTHMKSCNSGKSCPIPCCSSSRQIINHWKSCKSFDCPNLPVFDLSVDLD